MLETLILVQVVVFWYLLRRPKRDWYVVEWRTCFEEKLCTDAFSAPPDFGFGKDSLSAHHLTIGNKSSRGASLWHQGDRKINITQIVFDDLAAAMLYFERTKQLFPFGEGFHKAYLWRIVARSREKAIVLPPEQYISREGAVLQEFPPHLWFAPKKDEEDVELEVDH